MRCLVLCSDAELIDLASATRVFADATFRPTPKGKEWQLYAIHAEVTNCRKCSFDAIL